MAQFQGLYDSAVGGDAVDIPPQAVTDASAATPGYVVYLGHNSWFQRNSGNGWVDLGATPKSDFSGNVTAVYTMRP